MWTEEQLNELLQKSDVKIDSPPHRAEAKTEANAVVAKAKREVLEERFLDYWRILGDGSEWLRHEPVFPGDKRHVDFFMPDAGVAVEIQGGQGMKKSGHSSWTGLERDAWKLLHCHLMGIRLVHVTTSMLQEDMVVDVFRSLRTLVALGRLWVEREDEGRTIEKDSYREDENGMLWLV